MQEEFIKEFRQITKIITNKIIEYKIDDDQLIDACGKLLSLAFSQDVNFGLPAEENHLANQMLRKENFNSREEIL